VEDRTQGRKVRADLALMLCSLLWGATFVTVNEALSDASVFVFLAVRFGLAAALMAAVRWRALMSVTREEFFAGMRLGLFMFGGYAFQTAGLVYTTPAKSAFVTGSSVVMVPLLLAMLWGKNLSKWVYGGAAAAVAGLYLLTVPEAGFAHLNRGDLFTLVAALLYAVHIILVGEYTRKHSVEALSVLQVAACGALAGAASAVGAASGLEPARFSWTWGLIEGVLICAVLATAVAFSIQLWAQQYTTPSHAAILFTLEPVFAAVTSYFLMGERLGRRAFAGAVLVFVGILVAELLGPPAAPESPEPTG
jgi:drug/metabolite transporter (DMT)-like permease